MTHQRPRAPRGTGLWLVPALLFLAALAACGGKTAPPAPPPPPPTIISFQAAKSLVTMGKETTLTALYSDGKGVVDPGVGAIPAGFPVSTGPLTANTTFTLKVDGPGGTASKTVDVKTVAPPAVPIITVAPSVTADTMATASVPPQEGCTFAWTISGGTFSGPDTGSTVSFHVGTGNFVQLYCVAVNAAGTDSRPGLALCTVSTLPVQPVITAPLHVTAGQVGCTASVPASLTFACQWTIQGGTITAGARSNVVTFTAGNAGVVELRCTLTSPAGVTSDPGVARCTIVQTPTQPVIQAPPFAVANSQNNSASVTPQDGCTFLWTVTGGTLTSGDTTAGIRFTASASGSVSLSCVAVNAAGVRSQPGTATCPIVSTPPRPTLTAPTVVTANQPGYTASVPAMAGYGCEWTITGGTITSGPSMPSITFTPGSGSLVELTCAWRDSRGLLSPAGSAKCTILPVPATPVISAAMAHKAWDKATATVPAQTACTFAWTIVGGTFTGATNGPSINYTVSPNTPLRLGCTAINNAGSAGGTGTRDIPVTFTNNDVLIGLNIDTNPPLRKKADGVTDVTPQDQPFRKNRFVLKQVSEVLLASERSEGLKLFNADPAVNLTTLGNPANTADISSYYVKRPVAADMDGDGKQEVVLACFKGPRQTNDTITLYQIQGGATRTLTLKATLPWPGTRTFEDPWSVPHYFRQQEPIFRDWYFKIDFASGDIDGDGKDELVLAVENRLFLIDDNFSRISLTDAESTFTDMGRQILRVECADLDNDGRAELIVTNGNGDRDQAKTAEIAILRYKSGVLSKLVAPTPITNGMKALRSAEVKVGDLDGDGLPDIVLAGLAKGQSGENGMLRALVLQIKAEDIKTHPDGPWTLEYLPIHLDRAMSGTPRAAVGIWWYHDWELWRERDYAVPGLAVGDLDQDGRDEIAFNDSVLQYVAADPGKAATRTDPAVPPTPASLAYAFETGQGLLRGDSVDCWGPGQRDAAGTVLGDVWGTRQKDPSWYGQLTIGKLTPDGDPEIYVLDQSHTTAASQNFLEANRDVNWLRSSGAALRRYRVQNGRLVKEANLALSFESRIPFLCLADLDDDATRVEYIGTGRMMTKPIVLSVLASPPYWDGLSNPQNIGNSLTQFGQTVGQSSGVSASVGFSRSKMAGVKVGIPVVGNGELEVKVTNRESLDFTWDIEAAWERTISYETYAGTDAVLFASVPLDVYAYRVLDAGSSTTLNVGDVVYYYKNGAPQLQFTDIEFYNQHNGNEPDIEIFKHKLGKPFTYPTLAQATNLVNSDLDPRGMIQGFLMNSLQSGIVPRGNLYNTMSYSTSVSTGVSVAYENETTVEAEGSFVVLIGGSLGAKVGFSLWSKINAGEGISGSVGGLHPNDYKPENLYRWGIFSYNVGPARPLQLQAPFGVKVIDYWVERNQ